MSIKLMLKVCSVAALVVTYFSPWAPRNGTTLGTWL
jgi:hypothetical protein